MMKKILYYLSIAVIIAGIIFASFNIGFQKAEIVDDVENEDVAPPVETQYSTGLDVTLLEDNDTLLIKTLTSLTLDNIKASYELKEEVEELKTLVSDNPQAVLKYERVNDELARLKNDIEKNSKIEDMVNSVNNRIDNLFITITSVSIGLLGVNIFRLRK